jgi:hypothetical protein
MNEPKRRALPIIDIVVFLAAAALAVRHYMQHGTTELWRLLLFSAIAVFSLTSIVKYARQRP